MLVCQRRHKTIYCITEYRDQYKANGLEVTPVCQYGLYFFFFPFACMYVLKMVVFKFDLFGHLVIAHLERLRFRCAHSKNFWSLRICG